MSAGSEKQFKGSDLGAIQVSLSALSCRVLSSELKQTECMYYCILNRGLNEQNELIFLSALFIMVLQCMQPTS